MPTHLPHASRQQQSGPSLYAELGSFWRTLRRGCFDRYRPELHYMRGPGPRWREKHGEARP